MALMVGSLSVTNAIDWGSMKGMDNKKKQLKEQSLIYSRRWRNREKKKRDAKAAYEYLAREKARKQKEF
jgi:hypothetical protein